MNRQPATHDAKRRRFKPADRSRAKRRRVGSRQQPGSLYSDPGYRNQVSRRASTGREADQSRGRRHRHQACRQVHGRKHQGQSRSDHQGQSQHGPRWQQALRGTDVSNPRAVRRRRPVALSPDQPAPRRRPAPRPRRRAASARRASMYTVKDNDSLWKIASEQLGSGNRWTEIRDLNADSSKAANPST